MDEALFGYVLTRAQVLVILFLAGAAGCVTYWILSRHYRHRLETMAQELANVIEELNIMSGKVERAEKPNAYRHSNLLSGLTFIAAKSAETLGELGEEQIVAREKQELILCKAQDLFQHAQNVLDMADLDRDRSKPELLNVKGMVELVLREQFLCAQAKQITLLTDLADVEPTLLEREAVLQIVNNIVHNAIKYSFRGGVVETVLSIKIGELEGVEEAICIDAKDTGKGIPKDQQDKIFGQGVRGSGSVEPGRGLGLYLARKAARRLGGDVRLIHSSPNEGTVIRILLPYRGI